MYVCICNAVTDSKIRELAKQGYKIDAIIEQTGCSTGCGTCYDMLCETIEEVSDDD